MQSLAHLFSNCRGLSYPTSRLVNTPLNRVQNEYDNLHGNVHQQQLLEYWESGFALDLAEMEGFIPRSAHQEIDVKLVKR